MKLRMQKYFDVELFKVRIAHEMFTFDLSWLMNNSVFAACAA